MIIYLFNLDYPSHLHDLHSDYPLAPERNRSRKRYVIHEATGKFLVIQNIIQ